MNPIIQFNSIIFVPLTIDLVTKKLYIKLMTDDY